MNLFLNMHVSICRYVYIAVSIPVQVKICIHEEIKMIWATLKLQTVHPCFRNRTHLSIKNYVNIDFKEEKKF